MTTKKTTKLRPSYDQVTTKLRPSYDQEKK